MPGARQEDVSGAMMSILKKMDTMLESTNETYQQQVVLLNNIEMVQKNSVVVELKAQTKLLQSIDGKMAALSSGGGPDKGNMQAFRDAFGDISVAIEKVIKAGSKIDDKTSDRIANFFTKLGESINNFVKDVDAEKTKAAMDVLRSVASGVFLYSLALIISTPLLIAALPGAFLFGLSIRLLLKGMGEAKEADVEALKAVLGLARGILLYSLAIAAVTVLMPIVIIGSLLFGLSIRLLLLAAGTAKEGQVEAISAILGLARGALLYSLAMVVVALLSPIVMIGSALLGLSIRLLLMAAGTAKEGQVEAIKAILGLARAALLYSLAMVVVTLLSPIVIIGSILFGLSIRLLLMAAGGASRGQAAAMNAVLSLAKGILLYTLAMIVVTLLMPIVLIGTLIFMATLFLIGIGLRFIGSAQARRGVMTLVLTGLAILFYGLVIWAFNELVSWEALMKLGVAVGGIALIMYVMGKNSTTIFEGALVLAAIGIALLIFSIGFAIFAYAVKDITWERIGMMGAVIGVMALIGTLLGIPPIAEFAAAGAVVLILLGAAFAVFSVGFLIFATAVSMLDKDSPKIMGDSIREIGMAMVPIGLMSPLVILGAAAMVVAGAALIPITLGLITFKASGFAKEDSDNLSYALNKMISGFLGGDMPGGILASIKFAAQAAARAALLATTAIPMMMAGAALIPITLSLSIFKKAGFGKDDADNLEYMLSSVVKAFGIVTDYKRQKELGFYVNPLDLMRGIESLSGAGRVLAGLAQGVQSWAKLEVTEWEVINGGTKDAKLVIKGKRKLEKADFENAALGMAKVISAIAEPFAKVGKLEKGEPSGDPILDAIFGGGFVSAGISALKRSGDTLVSLAQGVQAFANLEITEFEVINAGTKDAKLVPKSIKKMDDTQIKAAGNNIAMIIGVVAEAFSKVGKDEKESSGIFSGGFVSKGVSALAGVGDLLKSITDGVLAMANREIPQFDLINAGTKDAKLVPGKPKIISDADLKNAATTIGDILGLVANKIAEIGKMEADSSGWFSGGYVTKGSKALAGVGDTVSKVADAVIKFATGEIPQFDVINAGTPDQKLVPGKSLKVTDAMLTSAAYKIGEIIGVVGREVNNFGMWVDENGEYISSATKAISSMTEVVSNAAKPLEIWANVKDPEKSIKVLLSYFSALKDVYDPTKNPAIDLSSFFFTRFAENAKLVGDNADAFVKVADQFDKIQKSMKLMQGHINGMDLKKLTLTDSMMRAIAAMSKNPEAIASMIGDTMEKSFQELINALKELAAANSPAPSEGSVSGGTTSVAGTTTTAPAGNTKKTVESGKKEGGGEKPSGNVKATITNWDGLATILQQYL